MGFLKLRKARAQNTRRYRRFCWRKMSAWLHVFFDVRSWFVRISGISDWNLWEFRNHLKILEVYWFKKFVQQDPISSKQSKTKFAMQPISSWWFQPIWKILGKIKNIWNHHLDISATETKPHFCPWHLAKCQAHRSSTPFCWSGSMTCLGRTYPNHWITSSHYQLLLVADGIWILQLWDVPSIWAHWC